MNEFTHIGLDVHKDTIAVAVLTPSGVTESGDSEVPEDYVQTTWSFRSVFNHRQESEIWASPLLTDYMWGAKPLLHALDVVEKTLLPCVMTSRLWSPPHQRQRRQSETPQGSGCQSGRAWPT